VDLPADDSAEAFMMQEVDAAVTYEPWLTAGKNTGHGHLLTDSSKQPGLITDCLGTTAGVLGDRRQEFKSVEAERRETLPSFQVSPTPIRMP
jgi:NitT/TauT family transport system substrate-binding protein